MLLFFFFSSRRRHTRCSRDWSSDVCSSDLRGEGLFHVLLRGTSDPANLLFGELRNIAAFHVLLHVFGEKKRGHQEGSIFLESGIGRIILQVTVFEGVQADLGGQRTAFPPLELVGNA